MSQNSDEDSLVDTDDVMNDTDILPELSTEETAEPKAEDEWSSRVPRLLRREIIHFDDGFDYLIIRTIETRKVGRRRKKEYRTLTTKTKIIESSLVEPRLATRIEFEPVEDDEEIEILFRLSWWEHGPPQLAIASGALVVSFGCLYLYFSDFGIPGALLFAGWLLATVAFGVWYFIIWMTWAFDYLFASNYQFGLVYCPPFSLPGTKQVSPIANITLTEANDQSWFANLLGRINPAYRYGKLNFDTPAQADQWMKEVKFVREHQRVRDIIASHMRGSNRQRESEPQRESRELQDRVNRRFLELNGDLRE